MKRTPSIYVDTSVIGGCCDPEFEKWSLRFRNDALHIATATVENVDILVSWNFRHVVHYDKIRRFNGVNLELGYKNIEIRSPREVATYGRESD